MRTSISIAVSCFCAGVLAQQQVWFQAKPAVSPSPRQAPFMAYDSTRGVVVLFSGETPNSTRSDETWTFDGSNWSKQSPPISPAKTLVGAMAHDSARGVTVLCGWVSSGMQTWEWDGTKWTLRTTSTVPPPRGLFAMVYDAARKRTVLFGGQYASTYLSDTWEYDGIDWQQRGSGGPPARSRHAMAYDSLRGRVTLFGGFRDSPRVVYGDTWEWDGSVWREHFGIPSPQARFHHGMAFDSARGVLVAYGGVDSTSSSTILGDTWEWDGTAWTEPKPYTTPGPVYHFGLVFDAARKTTVLFGGGRPTTRESNETWQYRTFTGSQPTYAPFGAGCMGTSGIPTLAADASTPLPYLGETFQVRLGNLPVGLGRVPFGMLGASKTQWGPVPLPLDLTGAGMPGCKLFVSGDLLFPLQNNNGSALWPLDIPRDLGFLGVPFYQQGLVLDPGANQASMILTNAGEGKVGIR